MITKRIIPCLDVKDGRVVKGINFDGLRDVSSPVALAEYYSGAGADELVFYDITASSDGRKLFTDILKKTAETVSAIEQYNLTNRKKDREISLSLSFFIDKHCICVHKSEAPHEAGQEMLFICTYLKQICTRSF